MRGRAALPLFAAALALAACAGLARPDGTETLRLASRNPVFLDDLLAGGGVPQRVAATLALPPGRRAGPVPAAVLVHTSSGEGSLEWDFAAALNRHGVAALVIDSFTPRGVYRTSNDQARVTEAAMTADAYAALAALADDPRIDPRRIALIGFSKGGTVALYAALARIADALRPRGPRFAAHVAFYPWCGLVPLDPRTTGAPVAVHIGTADDLTAAAPCAELIARLEDPDGGAAPVLHRYPGARHAFNHPVLSALPLLPMLVQNPAGCRIVERAPGRYVDPATGRAVTRETYAAVLESCLTTGGTAAYDAGAARRARDRTLRLIDRARAPRPAAPSERETADAVPVDQGGQ